MKRAWMVPLSLAAMSLMFFVVTIAPLTNQILRNLGAPPEVAYPLSTMIWNHTLLGFVALCSGIIFLAAMREENPSWYLGIPLVLGFAFIAFSPLVLGIFPLRDPTPAVYNPLVILSLVSTYGTFLLPVCVLLFFLSQRQLGKWRIVLVAIALVITLNSMCFWFSFAHSYLEAHGLLPAPQPVYVDGHPVKTDGEGILFLIGHYMFGLPILGLCLLALAAHTWHAGRKTVVPPSLAVQP